MLRLTRFVEGQKEQITQLNIQHITKRGGFK